MLHKNETPVALFGAIIFLACHRSAKKKRGVLVMDIPAVAKAVVLYMRRNRKDVRVRYKSKGGRLHVWVRDDLWDMFSAQLYTYHPHQHETKLKHTRGVRTGAAHQDDIVYALRWAWRIGYREMHHFDFNFKRTPSSVKTLITLIEVGLRH